MNRRSASAVAITGGLLLYGCAPRPLPPAPPLLEPLPTLPVEQIAPPPLTPLRPALFPQIPELEAHGEGPPITLSAANVDVRALIAAIAETLGLNLIIGPEVEGRLTIQFEEVPALVALRAVLDEAELALAGPAARPLWEPVVFYTLPVNIQDASPELVQARFGVSREAAEVATMTPR